MSTQKEQPTTSAPTNNIFLTRSQPKQALTTTKNSRQQKQHDKKKNSIKTSNKMQQN